MIDIANVAFTVAAPPLGEAGLERRASELFNQWDEYLRPSIPVPDYSLRLELAEGSLRGRGQIAATVLACTWASVTSEASFRPLAVTTRDTLAWAKTRPAADQAALADGQKAGISRAKEKEILDAWKATNQGAPSTVPA